MDSDWSGRLEWKAEDIYVLRNEDMQCANCANMIMDHGSDCEVYSQKPAFVMENRGTCPDFEQAGKARH